MISGCAPESGFRLLRVRQTGADFTARIETATLDELPEGEVTVRVEYSTVNYKDALSATGSPGVTRTYPHIPGIDAAGTVLESRVSAFRPGDAVIAGGGDFGALSPGGYSQVIRVPADRLIRLPEGLSTRTAMVYGTAGFTAALCVKAILGHGKRGGDSLVTGASGGVGSVAISMLARNGFSVTAVTGKRDAEPYLLELGAREVIGRQEAIDSSSRPLLPGRWDTVLDTVGGPMLATALRSCRPGAVAAICGNAASPELSLTVYPFILRGITLCGIDAPSILADARRKIWEQLATEWQSAELERISVECTFDELPHWFARVLRGEVTGRVVVRVADEL
ncbi:MAG TPA: YhdH/YhfP family quinone oxidoreductase [Spirochaetia bacterium]|nr:YhdH/YhfP family quinone oxidoreductase [Spirochaetia bacterium]